MGLDDAINRVERRLADDRVGWNEQNADRLREEQAELLRQKLQGALCRL